MTASDPPPVTSGPQTRPMYSYTELGNAERLIRDHGDDLLYVYAWRKWLVWDGTRWAPDTGGEVHRRAKEVVRALPLELATAEDAKELLKHIVRSEARKAIEAMIDLAAMFVPVAPDQLDADPWLLNAANGTIDLQTGELLAHRRDDLLTKRVPVAYDPHAEATTWEAFLKRVLPDEDVRLFVQRLAGYSITGVVRDHVLPILHGTGANGKSTFLTVVLRLLGDYAQKARRDLLMSGRQGAGAANPDVARLHGARFVAVVESSDAHRLDETIVKEITGGDRISARFLHVNPFEFDPTHTAWLATNHKPEVRGVDHAIWRRLKLVPFEVEIPEADQVGDLAETIVAAEAPGVLAWLVRGCLDWQERGLAEPDAVTLATSKYRDDQDVLGAFISDRCTLGTNLSVTAKRLHDAYRDWCEDNGEKPMSKKQLGMRLDDRGLKADRTKDKKQTRIRRGIDLIPVGSADAS